MTSPGGQGVREVQKSKAKKLSDTAKDAAVLRFCGFLFDTMTHLSSVSESLQRSTTTIAELSVFHIGNVA